LAGGVLQQSCEAAIQKAVAPVHRFLRHDAEFGGDFLALPPAEFPT
jgi:hypothetical protein